MENKLNPYWKSRQYDTVEVEKKIIKYHKQLYSSRQISEMKDIPYKKSMVLHIIRKYKKSIKIIDTVDLNKINKESLRQIIRQEMQALVKNQKQEEEEQQRYIPTEKAREMLDVCDSSLWRWTKKGLLTKKKISGRTYYDRTKILELLNNPM
tara:strand:- start:181 stop:636 length:456 start_codon:yes stop_codon:yes gene_type:complete